MEDEVKVADVRTSGTIEVWVRIEGLPRAPSSVYWVAAEEVILNYEKPLGSSFSWESVKVRVVGRVFDPAGTDCGYQFCTILQRSQPEWLKSLVRCYMPVS